MMVIKSLKGTGIGIYIDDFGTGYSSLSYLSQFKVKALKIDRSFVSQLMAGRDDISIVRSIISLGHNLGLKIIAEGVETAEQLTMLRDFKCDHIRGYYIAKPMSPENAAGMIGAVNR